MPHGNEYKIFHYVPTISCVKKLCKYQRIMALEWQMKTITEYYKNNIKNVTHNFMRRFINEKLQLEFILCDKNLSQFDQF